MFGDNNADIGVIRDPGVPGEVLPVLGNETVAGAAGTTASFASKGSVKPLCLALVQAEAKRTASSSRHPTQYRKTPHWCSTQRKQQQALCLWSLRMQPLQPKAPVPALAAKQKPLEAACWSRKS